MSAVSLRSLSRELPARGVLGYCFDPGNFSPSAIGDVGRGGDEHFRRSRWHHRLQGPRGRVSTPSMHGSSSRMARNRLEQLSPSNGRKRPPQGWMQANHSRHHRAAEQSYSFLRKTWVSTYGENRTLLWDAAS